MESGRNKKPEKTITSQEIESVMKNSQQKTAGPDGFTGGLYQIFKE